MVAGWARARVNQADLLVDLRDTHLSDREGYLLASTMERCERILSLDLRTSAGLEPATAAAAARLFWHGWLLLTCRGFELVRTRQAATQSSTCALTSSSA
jgi:hypothetical protein